MVGIEFINYLKKLKVSDFLGLEDFADKLSFMYTVLILLLGTTVISVKQYLLSSISCYIPTVPAGADFGKFLENFCWVHGTIPLLTGDNMPQTFDEWSEVDTLHRINYYQWVPFFLGLQCILFYMPHVIWGAICYNRTGTDLAHLVTVANKASNSNEKDKKKFVLHVTSTIDGLLFHRREYRQGRFAELRKKLFSIAGMLLPSKRMGTGIMVSYLFIKFLYLFNGIGQLYLMQKFLGFNYSTPYFGYFLTVNMLQGRDWNETRVFPRVTFCYLDNVRHLGAKNRYVAQCALPVNMLNEKLFVFLWFWVSLVVLCTAMSILLWIGRLGIRKNQSFFIKKFLRLQEIYSDDDRIILKKFIGEYLRHDGYFILRMVSINAGDVITSDVVVDLWHQYRERNINRKLLKDINDQVVLNEKIEADVKEVRTEI